MRRILLAFAVVGVLAACGIQNDDGPRDVPAGQQVELGVDTEHGAGATAGASRIYLLAPGAGELAPVARDVDETPEALLSALFEGPNATEFDAQYRTAIPTGTTLNSAVLRGGVLRVDVSDELLALSGDTLVQAIAQIVFTGSQVDGVRSVAITVDGAEQQWPAGNGELRNRPLTVYDYPGLLPSAQPDYPAVPSPSQP